MAKKIRYYHVSGYRFKVGDVLGGNGKTVYMTENPLIHYTIHEIFRTNSRSYQEHDDRREKMSKILWEKLEELRLKAPYPRTEEYWKQHDEIIDKVYSVFKPINYWVYEVKPFNKDDVRFCSCNDEYQTNGFVEIIRVVGNAKGIWKNFENKFKGKNLPFVNRVIKRNK